MDKEWGRRWAGRLGLGVGPVGPGSSGGVSFCFFVLFSFFVISFLLFICFSVLFQFKLFRHFIKMCLPHHIYLCKIWHLPNIFILIFENFCRLTYLGFKFETVLN